MDVVPLSLDSPEPLLREWAALDAAIQAELMPDLDPPPYAQSLRNLQPVAHLNRWGVAAVDGSSLYSTWSPSIRVMDKFAGLEHAAVRAKGNGDVETHLVSVLRGAFSLWD